MSESDEPKRVTRRKAERPAEILAAAFEEFVLNGYAATRLEDVATRANVTKGTIYFHFNSKENVFINVVHGMSKPMRCQTEEFLGRCPLQGIAFLMSCLDFYYDYILEDRYSREIFRLLISEAPRFPNLIDEHFKFVLEPVFCQIRKHHEDAIKSGEARETLAVEYPDLILSPMIALNISLLIFSDRKFIDRRKHLEAAKDMILRGLLTRS
jgi:AcrR family transcriptional regulator